jgi:hypothetical protein
LACEIVTLEVPELVSVPGKLVLLPTCTVPKLRLAGLAATVPPETPAPESETLSVGFDPLLAIVMPPLTEPLDWGANATLNTVLCPGERVSGSANPLKLKPFPVAVAWEMLTLEPPEFVRVPEAVRLLPIETLPKPMLNGDAAKEPAVTPVPERGRLRDAFDALLAKATAPLEVPPD